MNTDLRINDLALAMDQLLADVGPQALTMRRIARASGWSPSALSERFGTRNQLLRHCLRASALMRLDQTQWRVAAHGVVGLLPAAESAHEAARAWAGWVSVGHFEPDLEHTLLEVDCEEVRLISETLASCMGEQAAPTSAELRHGAGTDLHSMWSRPPATAVKALLDGIRWRMALRGVQRRLWVDAEPAALALSHDRAASQLLDGISSLVRTQRAA